ncbi:MAG: DUF3108 domain-containing protein [Alphaproteobacteria bacterium]
MGRKISHLNMPCGFFLAIGCFFFVFSAHAETYPRDFQFKGLYKVTFSGVAMGKVGVDFSQYAGHYTATSDIKTTGLMKMFTPHSSHSTVKATGADFQYDTVEYVTDYQTRNKKKHVEIRYANGAFKEARLVPPESPGKRPDVPEDLKDGSHDPLSSLINTRQKLIDAIETGQNQFKQQTYDGRRLTTITFRIMGKRNIRMNGRKVPVIQVNARRALTAGFTTSELDRYDPGEPALVIYFSNDEALFPVRLEIPIYMSVMQADLHTRCSAEQSCLLGNSD